MTKIIVLVLTFTHIHILAAQSNLNFLGNYEHKSQTGMIHSLVLEADSFIYRSATTLAQSEVRGTWQIKDNKLVLQSNVQIDDLLLVKETKQTPPHIKIQLQDNNNIGLGNTRITLNKQKKYTYQLDTLGKIELKGITQVETIQIKYLSYPTLEYQVKDTSSNLFEFTFLPKVNPLYRYFRGETWEIKKGLLIDISEGFKKKYRKK